MTFSSKLNCRVITSLLANIAFKCLRVRAQPHRLGDGGDWIVSGHVYGDVSRRRDQQACTGARREAERAKSERACAQGGVAGLQVRVPIGLQLPL